MPWNLLILPLVAGYYLLTRFYPFKYKQQRLDRQRLIFESVLLGVSISIIGYSLRIFAEIIIPQNIWQIICGVLPIQYPYIRTSFSILIITVLFTEIVNKFLSKENYIKKAIKDVGNEYELILKESFVNGQLLQITLNNGKVYIAWVKELPIPSISNYIRLIPAISGYRRDTKEIIYTTHYLKVYSKYIEEGKIKSIKELKVDLIINNSEIISVSYFDMEMNDKFNLG